MPSESLTLEGDLIPLDWFLTTSPTHWQALTNPGQSRNIFTLAPETVDLLDVTAPIGDVGNLLTLAFSVDFNLAIVGTADEIGVRWRLKNTAGGVLGSENDILGGSNFPFSIDYSFPLTGDGSDVTNPRFEIQSFGGNWTPGGSIIQIYQVRDMVLTYAPGTFEKVITTPETGIVDDMNLPGQIKDPRAVAPIVDTINVTSSVKEPLVLAPAQDTINVRAPIPTTEDP